VLSSHSNWADSEAQKEVHDLVNGLTDGLPADVDAGRDDEQGRWLMAQLLNWHRREAKARWWRYFFLRDELTDEGRREESDSLGELTFVGSSPDPAPRARSTIHRFQFPPQEHKLRVGDSPRDPETDSRAGTIVHLDNDAGIIGIKRKAADPAPSATSLIPGNDISDHPKPGSLQRLARWMIQYGIDGPGDHRATRDLLMRRPPRVGQSGHTALAETDENIQDAAHRLVTTLDQSYLAIQGPPGSGKSTVGAQMIVDLVAAGKRIGVTAISHKVIGELLEKAATTAGRQGIPITVGQRAGGEPTYADATVLPTPTAARKAIADGTVNVVGATAWLWAREDMANSVDVLFIDEAGQMSLADTVAASLCATNLVLLGDPQQLDQPLQGTHPPGAERSALAHLLNDAPVIPDHLGLFLDGTWRLHPRISAYTSEVFYEGRLHSHPGRDELNVVGVPPIDGAGIRFIAISHDGHASASPEEATAIAQHLEQVLAHNPTWTDADGVPHPLTKHDVLIITPYNAQVAALSEVLPDQQRIGTVDKFQGQEAPVSIYSMATSSIDVAPRGMEFLYNLNRLNVATSRAQCLAIVFASPAILHVRCTTPRQMRLANALARLLEVAT